MTDASPPAPAAFRVVVPLADEDVAVALLHEAGTLGIEVQEAGRPGAVCLLSYFPAGVSSSALRAALRPLPSARAEAVEVPEVDWVARFREGFRGFDAGPFRIAPAWDAPAPRPDLIVVDPGRAFGTGTHETTRLCLSALAALAGGRPLGRVLDLGTGTGILAVAARRLGASAVVAADLDPEALEAARAHAALNATDLAVVMADGGAAFARRAFDVVVANLSAPLLRELEPELRDLPRPGGTLVVSGFLDADVPGLSAAFARAGEPEARFDGEWACLVWASTPLGEEG